MNFEDFGSRKQSLNFDLLVIRVTIQNAGVGCQRELPVKLRVQVLRES